MVGVALTALVAYYIGPELLPVLRLASSNRREIWYHAHNLVSSALER